MIPPQIVIFFAKKKMKKSLIVLAACAAFVSCSYSRVDRADSDAQPSSGNKSLWASAVIFPDGYDWRKDSLGGEVQTKLMLFDGRDSLLSIEVSDGNHIGADADMHRIVDGQLYCDYSSDSLTFISRNGVEILRWSGRENITGFRIRNGDIFTLGSARSGQGWSFRKNGAVLMSRSKGFLYGPLYEDGDSLCFTFVEPITYEGKEAGRRYYYTCGNKVSQYVPGEDITQVNAMRLYGGRLNRLENSKKFTGLLWQKGDDTILLDMLYAEKTRAHSFYVAGDALYAHAQRQVFWWIDTFWSGSDIADTSGSAFQVYALQDGSPFICFVYSKDGGTSSLGVDVKGEKHLLPPSLKMMCSNAFCCDDRQCCIGLNDANDNYRPLIIKGVDTLRFDFNGYFTSLCLP